MTTRDIRNSWAWSRVEAMADGSLDGTETERMRVAMRQDEGLNAAVKRARQVRAGLARLQGARPPPGLLSRLLAVPPTGRFSWPRLTAPVGAFAVAVIAALLVTVGREPVDPRAQAAREFALAMSYLQRSAVVARDEVQVHVGSGFADALAASRASLSEVSLSSDDNGG